MRDDIKYYIDVDENGNHKLSYCDRICLNVLIVGMVGFITGTFILGGYTIYKCIFSFL
jgi:hypothetical protein